MSTARYRFRIQHTDTLATFIIIPFKSIERFYGNSIPDIVTVLECTDDTDYVIETCHYPVFQLPVSVGHGAMLVAETMPAALTELRECLSSVALGLSDDTIRDVNGVVTDAMLVVMIQRHMPMPYVQMLKLHNPDHFTPSPHEATDGLYDREYRFTFNHTDDLLTYIIVPFHRIIRYGQGPVSGIARLTGPLHPPSTEHQIATMGYPLFQIERMADGRFLEATTEAAAMAEIREHLKTCRVGYKGTYRHDCNTLVTTAMLYEMLRQPPLTRTIEPTVPYTVIPTPERPEIQGEPYHLIPRQLVRIPEIKLMADASAFWIDGFMRFHWTHFENMEGHLLDMLADQYGESTGQQLWDAITQYRNAMLTPV